MAQAQRILRDGLVEFRARRSAAVAQQRLIASEGTQPVAGWDFARSDAQFSEQIGEGAALPQADAGDRGSGLEEMKVRVDEARDYGTAAQLDQVAARPDHRFQIGEFAVGENRAVQDRDRIALRMPEDYPLVKDQIGLVERHRRLESPPPAERIALVRIRS